MSEHSTPAQEHEELLTIREAAAFLNVSAVSLRRWTDAGRLPCLRVGGRRERRFRARDLLAFTDGPGAEDSTDASRTSTGTVLEGLLMDYSSHLCSMYESDLGRVKLAVPFLAEGLRQNDVCIVVASTEAQSQILSGLGVEVNDLGAARSAGQLITSRGEASGAQMYDYLEAQFIAATRGQDCGLRVVGDMAWSLDKGMGSDELRDFEMRFDQYLAHTYPVISLCQYDARRFSGVGMLGALKTHRDTFDFPLTRFLAN